jgi:tRNA nucleotidyltransferase (CCA-adding enzyme)
VNAVGAASASPDGRQVLESLGDRAGGPELLALAQARDDVALVGGATRDLLLGGAPRELDIVVAAGAGAFAGELAARLGESSAGVTLHERFGTAVVEWPAGRIDVAERRAESYPVPGALPEVRPGTVEEDLRRRDFTVNAIAVAVGGPRPGELCAAEHALEDLAAARLRVMHERSFIEDPTRLLRLARYRARLAFQPEPHTAELAAEAIGDGALATVSGARIGAELRLALAEPDPVAALAALDELGVLAAIDSRLRFDDELARRALSMLPEDGRANLLLLAVTLLALATSGGADAEAAIAGLLDRLEFTAPERVRALRSALLAPALVSQLRGATRPSEVREAAVSSPLEGVALAGALGEGKSDAATAAADQWLRGSRHVRLTITGEDLLAAGVPAGPEIGRRLAIALRRKLDGELADGREAELRAALEAPL